jgi:hypothetical protein
VWAVLERAGRGVNMTGTRLRRLHDLRRRILDSPA